MAQADIGLVGLAVMGENLILNMESKGFTVACFNRTISKVDDFINGRAKGKKIIGCKTIEEFVASLKTPRKIMLMVKAGQAVDDFIELLLPHLGNGDILIDGGNSHFPDTIRRTQYVESKGKLYIGTGVSGGEEGALRGPSIMPGGSPAAWPHIKPIFQAICAKTDDGSPCCDWVGENGAGHFVKMVHIEITSDILAYKDEQGNEVVDLILDAAGQKGTGKWTVVAALDSGQPLTLVGEAVFARCLSAIKEERVEASKILRGPKAKFKSDKKKFINDLRYALYASKIVSYAQGYQLMRAAAKEYKWNLNNGGIALMWRGGCIIRSVFLGDIKKAFDKNPNLVNLLLDPFFKRAVTKAMPCWRRVVSAAIKLGVPMPAISSALAYYDGYRHERLPANLLQAQRDYFGAHTYERVDKPRGQFFHTNWTGRGGQTAASTYTA
jgi:6-phosphogluconate dehydrogenase